MGDQLIRFVTRSGHFRAIVAVTTELCETARVMQGTDPTATVALARVATGTALLGGLLKGRQRLVLAIEANGPLQKLHAETDADGHVRCSVKNPLADLPPRNDRFDVAGAVGRAGFLHVIKDLGLKEPYRGMVQLQTSEIGDDIAYYLTVSEQVPSSVSLGVSLGPDAGVQAAGGFIVQALPGSPDEAIGEIENRILKLPPLSEMLREQVPIRDILGKLFVDGDMNKAESIPLSFRCNCSREQVARMLRNLGRKELAGMTEGEETVDVTCEYCRRVYRFEPPELDG